MKRIVSACLVIAAAGLLLVALSPRDTKALGASGVTALGAQLKQSTVPVPTVPSPCDNVCTDASCISMPLGWLPPVTITEGFVIYPTTVCLCSNGGGSMRVEGDGEVFLPNMQTGQGADAIQASFVLDWPSLEPQCVALSGSWPEGIPIGEAGFLLTSLDAELALQPEPALRGQGTIESVLQAPDGSGPAVTGEGAIEMSLQEPYTFSFSGTLTVLGVHSVQATATLDQSWGFAGQAIFTGPSYQGPAYVHIWQEGEEDYGFSGSATLTCTLEAGTFNPTDWPDWLPDIPGQNITTTAFAEVGELCLECKEGSCDEATYGICGGTTIDLSLPESVVEPGPIALRFCLSPTGTVALGTNLESCGAAGLAAVPDRFDREPNQACTSRLFCLNSAPAITVTSPSAVEEPASGSYTIRWLADDADGDASVSLFYDRDAEGRDGRLITHCLDARDGVYVWDTSEVGNGIYYVYGRIDDGKNLPVVSYSAGTAKVVDDAAPSQVAKPTIHLDGGVPEVHWTANLEGDVVGYRVYVGPQPSAYAESYDATNVTRFRLPEAPSCQSRYMAVSAYDSSGNEGVVSEPVEIGLVLLPMVVVSD